jgi:pimeloyl-ACP methyl ester carboxylesterase
MTTRANHVVLVHGAFVDGSTWRGVYDDLSADGYQVAVVQIPTVSLGADVEVVQRALDAQGGPVVLVGHSYGGAVITEAGNRAAVTALVYVAAFVPDAGESVEALGGDTSIEGSPIVEAPGGVLFQNRATFHTAFGADLSAADAAFLADAQVPWGMNAMTETVSEAAWRHTPSWYLVATDDRMIPPPKQRAMATRAGATTVEVAASHAVYISQPHSVAALIRQACG